MNLCRNGSSDEIDDIIDFANYVFSQDSCPHDFKKLLPKLYSDKWNYAQNHYLIKEADKIKAMVCVLPIPYITPTAVIKAACIGTVSVHPYARGKGYMKVLMKQLLEDLKAQGYSYLFLGGQRQRYEYFGFTPAGTQFEFTVTATNVYHCFRAIPLPSLQLVPLTGEELTDQAFALYETQPYRMERSKEAFYDILCSWKSKPYAILSEEKFTGYLVLRPDGSVTEWLIKDSSLCPAVLKELLHISGLDTLSFLVSSSEMDKIEFFMRIAENWRITANESYRILDWPAVITALLSCKAKSEVIPEGSLQVSIDDITLEINVCDQKPSVKTSKETADICLSSLEATSLLLSYAGKPLLIPYASRLNREERECFLGWFPLPLYVSQCDCC
jgi:Predicted acetyltransferase involved in intracellular survival and related acetyltransferases